MHLMMFSDMNVSILSQHSATNFGDFRERKDQDAHPRRNQQL